SSVSAKMSKPGRCICHEDCVWTVAFSPSGNLLASGSDDFSVKIWDMNHSNCIRTLNRHKSRVSSVSFTQDGQFLASAGLHGEINIWNPYSGKHLRTLEGHTNRIQTVVFNPVNGHLVSCSYDETVRIWDIATGKCLRILSNRPYGGTNIQGVKGLGSSEVLKLKELGAIEA
ncbi:MAG: hypothetical protein AAF329_25555, partial [Cyanobacteria bacterium P01_A01_bin.17]